jgi:hypothetical protein
MSRHDENEATFPTEALAALYALTPVARARPGA